MRRTLGGGREWQRRRLRRKDEPEEELKKKKGARRTREGEEKEKLFDTKSAKFEMWPLKDREEDTWRRDGAMAYRYIHRHYTRGDYFSYGCRY